MKYVSKKSKVIEASSSYKFKEEDTTVVKIEKNIKGVNKKSDTNKEYKMDSLLMKKYGWDKIEKPKTIDE